MTRANGFAAPSGRTWSIVTTTGERVSGFLPAWAEDDPSRTGVDPGRLHIALSDVTHETFFGGQFVPVCQGAQEEGEDSAVLSAVMRCRPFATDDRTSVTAPLVSIQLVDDFWIRDLDPPGVIEAAGQFRGFADLLLTTVAPALTAARTDWTEQLRPVPEQF